MGPNGDILIVGGYGVVGRLIAGHLAPQFPGRVVIAGPEAARGAALCRALGHGTRALRLDVNDSEQIGAALNGVGTVMACVAQAEPRLLRAAVACGIGYTDIAPRLAFWEGAEELHRQAVETGARVLLGAGLSPGISNMMARKLADRVGRAERIETSILLSLGDAFGADSLQHVVESLKHPFKLFRNGRYETATPFSDPARTLFSSLGPRAAYVFPWSDVVYYPKTLGVRTAVGRLALDPPWVGRLLRFLVKAGAPRWLEQHGLLGKQSRVIERLKGACAGIDHFALRVTIEGAGQSASMSLTGHRQAEVTAAGGAELCRMLAAHEVSKPGVWLPEQVVSADAFFSALERLGWHARLNE